MNERLNDKSITFYEIMKNADASSDPVEYLKHIMKKDSRLNAMLGYALNPKFKTPMPEGVPPYIPSQHPIGVAPLEILNLSNKYYVMFSKDMKQFQKEQILVAWLEQMAPEEAEIMTYIKDQTLHTIYKNVTLDVLLAAMGWTHEQFLKVKTAALTN